jgi:predicted kinase
MQKEANGTLFIMRGLPGSGKSTLAQQLGGVVYSTDEFFMVNGEYCFDVSKLGTFHEMNQRRTEVAMQCREPVIVVDNTNIQSWQMRPYILLADQYGYRVEIKMPDTPWMWDVDVLAERNTHKVPRETLQKMKNSFQHNLAVEQIRDSGSNENLHTEKSQVRVCHPLP